MAPGRQTRNNELYLSRTEKVRFFWLREVPVAANMHGFLQAAERSLFLSIYQWQWMADSPRGPLRPNESNGEPPLRLLLQPFRCRMTGHHESSATPCLFHSSDALAHKATPKLGKLRAAASGTKRQEFCSNHLRSPRSFSVELPVQETFPNAQYWPVRNDRNRRKTQAAPEYIRRQTFHFPTTQLPLSTIELLRLNSNRYVPPVRRASE